MEISIADFNFIIDSSAIPMLESGTYHWAVTQYKLYNISRKPQDTVNVTITDRPAPETSSFTQIVDNNVSWNLYNRIDDYLLVEFTPQFKSPVTVSLFNLQQKSITIYCSQEYVLLLEQGIKLHPFSYPLDQVFTSFLLAANSGTLLHATGWEHHGHTWVFPGVSGAGKSTLSYLIHEVTGEQLLSDDRVAIRQRGEQIFGYGTPWLSDEGHAINKGNPVKGVFFLQQGMKNEIRKLTPFEGFSRIMPVMTVPWYDKVHVAKMMDFTDHLLNIVPVYEFTFTKSFKAVDKLLEFKG